MYLGLITAFVESGSFFLPETLLYTKAQPYFCAIQLASDRRGFWGIFCVSLLLAVLLLQTEVGEGAASPADWPMFHANLQRTGTTSEIVTPPLILKWKYETEGSYFGGPVISGGIVYVSSGDNRVEPYRYALDALDAKLRTAFQ